MSQWQLCLMHIHNCVAYLCLGAAVAPVRHCWPGWQVRPLSNVSPWQVTYPATTWGSPSPACSSTPQLRGWSVVHQLPPHDTQWLNSTLLAACGSWSQILPGMTVAFGNGRVRFSLLDHGCWWAWSRTVHCPGSSCPAISAGHCWLYRLVVITCE